LYRGLKLWQAAVKEAGTLEQDAVIRALDHARIAEGPGGGAEMVPGQHHVRMNIYIAQAHGGRFEVVQELGVIEPKERQVPQLRAHKNPMIPTKEGQLTLGSPSPRSWAASSRPEPSSSSNRGSRYAPQSSDPPGGPPSFHDDARD
jgi:substrate-binding family protein